MKKTIFISGIVSANLMMTGAIMKTMHWPGANILLCLAVFVFCFFFLPMGIAACFRSQQSKTYRWLSVVTFSVFFIVLISALFKIMHWPGAGVLLLISLPLPFVVFLPVFLFSIKKDKDYPASNLLGIMFGLAFIAVFGALLALSVSKNIITGMSDDIQWLGKAIPYNASYSNPNSDNPVSKNADDICRFIDKLKCEILTIATDIPCNEGKTANGIPVGLLSGADNTDAAAIVLFRQDGIRNADILKEKILAFNSAVTTVSGEDNNVKELAEKLLSISEKTQNARQQSEISQGEPWEQTEFPNTNMIAVYDALTRIQYNVCFIEAELIKTRLK